MELLLRKIKNDKDIKGVLIKDEEIKQSLSADDATYLTNGEKNLFELLIKTINEFVVVFQD